MTNNSTCIDIKKLSKYLNKNRDYVISFIPNGDYTRAHEIAFSGIEIGKALNSLAEYEGCCADDMEAFLSDYMEIYGSLALNKSAYEDDDFDKVVFVECAMAGCPDCYALLQKNIATWIALSLEEYAEFAKEHPEENAVKYPVYYNTETVPDFPYGAPPKCFGEHTNPKS